MNHDRADAAWAAAVGADADALERDGLDEVLVAVRLARARLDAGDLTAAHLDAMHAAARNLPEAVRAEYLSHTDELLERAEHVSLEVFQRECRALAKHCLARSRRGDEVDELAEQRAASKIRRWVDSATGMHHTLLELDPVRRQAQRGHQP